MLSLESKILFFVVLLGFLQLFVAAATATRQRGTRWNLSPRDEPPAPLKGLAGRWHRAFENFKETFPFFLAAVFLISISGRGGRISEAGSWVYLIARIVYVPLYIVGIAGIRTAVWIVSVGGIGAILAQLLLR